MVELDADWGTLDGWWQQFVQNQKRDLEKLRTKIAALDEAWAQSDCVFDVDPLAADWTETNPQAGPLRAQEENWSQWLAHILRSSSGDFVSTLFDDVYTSPPATVRREQAYHDDELHDRRVDIILEWPNYGLSIEVKIDDTAYEKTPQTAYLTEQHHSRDLQWRHYLLVPEAKRSAVSEIFGSRLDVDGDRPTITPDGTAEQPVTVVYWLEVSQGLRQDLLTDGDASPHWQASAYLLITLIEQKILQFYADPLLTEMFDTTVGVSDIDRIQSIEPRDQLEYLERTMDSQHE